MTVEGRSLSARFIVLATGAMPMPLPFDGARHMITSTEYMELDRLPPTIIFIGGGFISFEFAHFAVRLGPDGARCTILEAGPRTLGPFDAEMAALLVVASAKEGIDTRTDVNITAVETSGHGFTVATEDGRRFDADLVVNGAGRAPNISDLDLDKAGIASSKKGIEVDKSMATSNEYVYAVGDCVASVQLARVADYEARVASANILRRLHGGRVKTFAPEAVMDYTAVPSILFTYPQYGMVGATEDALKEKGTSYRKSFGKSLDWPTYRRIGMESAAYKILAGEDGKILGAHILSDNATGVINTFTMAMANKLSVQTLYHQSILTPYPSRESDIINMIEPFF